MSSRKAISDSRSLVRQPLPKRGVSTNAPGQQRISLRQWMAGVCIQLTRKRLRCDVIHVVGAQPAGDSVTQPPNGRTLVLRHHRLVKGSQDDYHIVAPFTQEAYRALKGMPLEGGVRF